VAKVIVYHDSYGCETGCCGHTVEILQDGEEQYRGSQRKFEFTHPYTDDQEEWIEFAKDLVRKTYGEKHVADLAWDQCEINDDW
jgi:hypothetical protein